MNYIMCKSEISKFDNALILDKHGNQQDQNFVISPLTGTQYLIYCDGTLYWYLLYQSKKDYQEYVKKFPSLMDSNPK